MHFVVREKVGETQLPIESQRSTTIRAANGGTHRVELVVGTSDG